MMEQNYIILIILAIIAFLVVKFVKRISKIIYFIIVFSLLYIFYLNVTGQEPAKKIIEKVTQTININQSIKKNKNERDALIKLINQTPKSTKKNLSQKLDKLNEVLESNEDLNEIYEKSQDIIDNWHN